MASIKGIRPNKNGWYWTTITLRKSGTNKLVKSRPINKEKTIFKIHSNAHSTLKDNQEPDWKPIPGKPGWYATEMYIETIVEFWDWIY